AGERFWYQLPTLTKRHLPELFVPRVNDAAPQTRLNPFSAFVIDANFSTLWTAPQCTFDHYALLAMLNSTWCLTCMEIFGTVMGGGALKLEATQLKRIPLPVMDKNQ